MNMNKKPSLSFWQIWNMCFGFLGIQFGFALQNSNVSRIFQTLGADIDDIPILWIAAPVTGLLVQPIIGYYSDKTWNRFGRRRPYFLLGAILASIALLFMPHSPTLWIAAGTLWIMDASINVAMEPFRAFVGDMLPEEQRTRGFTMQSFFIGLGAVAASAMPWIMTNWLGISNTAPAGIIPESVTYAFYCGGVVFLLAVLWTVFSTKEYTPEQLAAFEQHIQANTSAHTTTIVERSTGTYFRAGIIWLASGCVFTAVISQQVWDQQLYILAAMIAAFGVMQLIAGLLQQQGKTESGFYTVTRDVFQMPRTMKQLAVVQFFSWFALFSMWIYTTAAVTDFHYGSRNTTDALYNEGADWVGLLFAGYNGFAALAAFFIPVMANRFNRKIAHMICLSLGGLGLISFIFINDPTWLLASMVGVGFAWASILSMPYAILSCSLPSHKMGTYIGIFNFFIVIPQILAASVLGLIVRELFAGKAIYALVCGGVFMFAAALATLWVEDKT
jgi:maltose/moltooligosaccharide transporter